MNFDDSYAPRFIFYLGQLAGPNYRNHIGEAEAGAAGGAAKSDHLVSLTIYFKLEGHNQI